MPDKIKHICEICDSDNRVCCFDNKYYCQKHYQQMKTYGHIRERTNRELNEIIIYDTYADIILYDENQIEEARAPIDLEDVDKCKNHRWNLTVQKYVANHILGGLHNYVMNFEPPKDKSKVVNHIDRDRKNCRKYNLEITTYQVNGINKGKQSNNTSGFPGVSWDNYHGKWEAHIKLNGKKKFLGYHINIEDAVKARQEGEVEYFGALVNRDNDINTVFKNKAINK